MNFLDIQNDLMIDMLRSSRGCPEQCRHCGAYSENIGQEDLRISEVQVYVFEDILMRQIEGSRRQIKDLLADIITTDVNSEPLQTKNFPELAALVHRVTNGESRMAVISHGVRIGVKKMYDQLQSIVDLIKKDVIRNFVLSMDFARLQGKIDEKKNEDSYMETLRQLRSILFMPEMRVTVSLQGTSDSETMYVLIQSRLKEKDHWSEEEIRMLNVDRRGSYVRVGRAKSLITPPEAVDCEIIPDEELVRRIRSRGTKKFRGRIDGFRRVLEAQLLRPGMTYSDTLDAGRWEIVWRF